MKWYCLLALSVSLMVEESHAAAPPVSREKESSLVARLNDETGEEHRIVREKRAPFGKLALLGGAAVLGKKALLLGSALVGGKALVGAGIFGAGLYKAKQ